MVHSDYTHKSLTKRGSDTNLMVVTGGKKHTIEEEKESYLIKVERRDV